MAQQSTREKLLQAARRLLEEDVPPDELTARRLTAEAGVNLSMINYCFHSKDALLKAAVDEIVAAEFRRHAGEAPPGSTPRQQLRARLLPVCLAMLKYRALTQASIPYLLLEEPISLPLDILPDLRAHFGPAKSEETCRLAAFGLVYTMQLTFYRGEEFQRYYGPEIYSDAGAAAFLDAQLDLFLGGE